MPSTIVRDLLSDCYRQKAIAACSRSRRRSRQGGPVRLPMDYIDRRREAAYRASQVIIYYLGGGRNL
jgi:hypothetical protein